MHYTPAKLSGTQSEIRNDTSCTQQEYKRFFFERLLAAHKKEP